MTTQHPKEKKTNAKIITLTKDQADRRKARIAAREAALTDEQKKARTANKDVQKTSRDARIAKRQAAKNPSPPVKASPAAPAAAAPVAQPPVK